MPARFDHLLQLFGRCADEATRREQLSSRHDFVIGSREQKDRYVKLRQINRLSKSDEPSFRNLIFPEQEFDNLQVKTSG